MCFRRLQYKSTGLDSGMVRDMMGKAPWMCDREGGVFFGGVCVMDRREIAHSMTPSPSSRWTRNPPPTSSIARKSRCQLCSPYARRPSGRAARKSRASLRHSPHTLHATGSVRDMPDPHSRLLQTHNPPQSTPHSKPAAPSTNPPHKAAPEGHARARHRGTVVPGVAPCRPYRKAGKGSAVEVGGSSDGTCAEGHHYHRS